MNFLKRITKVQLIAVAVVTLISFGAVYALTSSMRSNVSKQSDCKDTCVALTEKGANPNSIAVTLGSYVQFNSADGKSHNLSIGKGGEEHDHSGKFYSGEFKADEAWRVQFKEEGTFTFHDHLNPEINVVVVVYQAGKDYKVE